MTASSGEVALPSSGAPSAGAPASSAPRVRAEATVRTWERCTVSCPPWSALPRIGNTVG
ncbi:hypothetical protein [Ornithinimicrobium kibberense]|uniref:hypothetical protein n=1 Tax=Ornithinimicrobium kibberense TaxID=282060 RepID=UPI0036197DE7